MKRKVRVDRGPVGTMMNPRHVGTPSAYTRELARFGRAVLAILDESPVWNAGTLERLAEAADICGLATEDSTPVLAAVLAERRRKRAAA